MAKVVDEPSEPHVQELEVTTPWGMQKFTVNPGAHTILIDSKFLQQKAIADFLQYARIRSSSPGRGTIGIRELIAVALGAFDVPMELIFADDENLRSEFDLDDITLATIVRLRHERKTDAEHTS